MKIFHKNNLKLKKAIYPTILGIFIIIGSFVFVYSVRFLLGAVNKAFYIDNKIVESKMIKVDLDKLKQVISKLNIKLGETAIEVVSSSSPSSSEYSVSSASSSPVIQLDKKSVKIAIYNGTKLKGLASGLKEMMVKDGFVVSKTDNVSATTGTTTIKTKNSKKDYLPLVKESVSKKYATIDDGDIDEAGEYDIIITIGGK